MHNIFHATFATAEDGNRAVRALLYHGVPPQDILLISPQSHHNDSRQTVALQKATPPVAHPRSAKPVPVAYHPATRETKAGMPPPSEWRPLSWRDALQDYRGDLLVPDAPGYRTRPLGIAVHDPTPSKEPASRPDSRCEAIVDAKEGAGLGLGLGLMIALCLRGIGVIAGMGIIILSMVAGGIIGGMYGYLSDRSVAQKFAQVLRNSVKAEGATVRVTVYDNREKVAILRILKCFGGHIRL